MPQWMPAAKKPCGAVTPPGMGFSVILLTE
jgi:hypothetical protein